MTSAYCVPTTAAATFMLRQSGRDDRTDIGDDRLSRFRLL